MVRDSREQAIDHGLGDDAELLDARMWQELEPINEEDYDGQEFEEMTERFDQEKKAYLANLADLDYFVAN